MYLVNFAVFWIDVELIFRPLGVDSEQSPVPVLELRGGPGGPGPLNRNGGPPNSSIFEGP